MSDKPVRIDGASIYLGGSAGDADPPVLSAGSSHTLALLPADGRVLVWGSNTEGQLGLGADSEETVYLPVVLKLDLGPDEAVKQVKIFTLIFSAIQHSIKI